MMNESPNDVALVQAYMHKLVELDWPPQFAEPIAEKLVKLRRITHWRGR